MARELNEQWVELIDGQEHMVKLVEGKVDRANRCGGCAFRNEYKKLCEIRGGVKHISEVGCARQHLIIKDLGVLNEDGCLPSPLGGYPKIIHEVDQNRTENGEDVHYDNLWCVEIHEPFLICTNEYPTKQEAIDAWNRRA